MTEQYGKFHFIEAEEEIHSWGADVATWFFKHRKGGILFLFISLGAMAFLSWHWPTLARYITSTLLLLLRYLLLVVVVLLFYEKWGRHRKNDSRWDDIVRFTLFFIVPFVALDFVLHTGLLKLVLQTIESIKSVF